MLGEKKQTNRQAVRQKSKNAGRLADVTG